MSNISEIDSAISSRIVQRAAVGHAKYGTTMDRVDAASAGRTDGCGGVPGEVDQFVAGGEAHLAPINREVLETPSPSMA
jgi:hypothetical protein